MLKFLTFVLLLSCASSRPPQQLTQTPNSYRESKEILSRIHQDHPYTLYCGCRFQDKQIDLKSCGYLVYKNEKRASRLEWEHVVPAHAFGHSFPEWRRGGRKAAYKNPEYRMMEADMHNLWPEIGELNQLRSNYAMTDFGDNDRRKNEITFGNCQARISDRKFEPMNRAKGIVARTYMYMDLTYPGRGIISRKNRKLFEAWDRMYPAGPWECARSRRIEAIQKRINPILTDRCQKM